MLHASWLTYLYTFPRFSQDAYLAKGEQGDGKKALEKGLALCKIHDGKAGMPPFMVADLNGRAAPPPVTPPLADPPPVTAPLAAPPPVAPPLAGPPPVIPLLAALPPVTPPLAAPPPITPPLAALPPVTPPLAAPPPVMLRLACRPLWLLT
jgi:hypothetical protein